MYSLDMGSLNYQYGVQLECLEDTPEQLLAQLALHHRVSVLGRPDLA